ncbi:phosphatase PAP2 family protein [Streptacidiphilus sp. MAP5-3]|uniref:phosphatase PAP2 family protein n=1 Tax=unclassified Streptacidiphilus TaxID=2643834 RepID=UPI003511D68C
MSALQPTAVAHGAVQSGAIHIGAVHVDAAQAGAAQAAGLHSIAPQSINLHNLALSGPSIDGGLYSWFTQQAQSAPHWFDDLISFYATLGLGFFALLMVWGWWQARQARDPRAMTTALAVPVAVVVAFVVNDVIKSLVTEVRPCQAIPGTVTLQPCPGVGDWSFPSNHATIAAASAAALWLVNRYLGIIAAALALVMAFARVWVGAHYPHDVVVGLLVGTAVALPTMLLARRYAPPLVARMQSGVLRPLLTAS